MDISTMSPHPVLCILWGLLHLSYSEVSGIKDYCIADYVNITCPKDQVILMTHALYGRMKRGRCIEGEGGHLGCSSNVISTFDAECSGRASCNVPVRDFLSLKPCKKDFQNYVEAAYTCIQIPQATTDGCSMNHGVLIGGSAGFIMYSNKPQAGSHHLTSHRMPGMVDCPWNIKVKDGQKINLTVMIFGDAKDRKYCNTKLQVEDGRDHTEVSLCEEDLSRGAVGSVSHGRERLVYTSTHSHISAFISQSSRAQSSSATKYMLRYQAVGCANMTVPALAWAIRQDTDTLQVTCNNTGEVWYLTCTGSTWAGEIGNCTKGTRNSKRSKPHSTLIYHGKLGIIFAVMIGIVLGVTIGALLLLLVHCYKRKKKDSQQNNFVMVPQDTKDKFYEEGTYKPSANPKAGQLKDAYPALLRDTEPYDPHATANIQGIHKQCFSVDNHNMQIKTFPHDRTLYHSLDNKCGDCACPNTVNRCGDVPGSRYIDVE